MTPILSSWCPPAGHDASQHAVCQMRQHDEDPRKRLESRPCQMHGGHETPKESNA